MCCEFLETHHQASQENEFQYISIHVYGFITMYDFCLLIWLFISALYLINTINSVLLVLPTVQVGGVEQKFLSSIMRGNTKFESVLKNHTQNVHVIVVFLFPSACMFFLTKIRSFIHSPIRATGTGTGTGTGRVVLHPHNWIFF